MKTILKIKFDLSLYIFLFLILLTGMFKQYTFVFILIIIHELGHALTGKILGFKFDKIIIYPYGGITKFNTLENHSLNKEMIVILMGPLMQFLGYLIINYYFHYEYIKLYNYSILIFNLLPILSLDGGLFVNLILNKFFSYRKSFYISFIISLFGIAYLILYSFKYYYNLNLFFMSIFLFFKLIYNFKNFKYNYHKFLLERYLYNFSFKKRKVSKNIYNFSKEYYHYIKFQDEKKCLNNYFKNN